MEVRLVWPTTDVQVFEARLALGMSSLRDNALGVSMLMRWNPIKGLGD